MKAFTVSAAFAILLAQAHASPMKAETRDVPDVQITFEGAPPQAAAFTVTVPADGEELIIGECCLYIRLADLRSLPDCSA